MRYTFQLTKGQLLEYSIRAVWDLHLRRRRTWLILLVICVLESFLIPWLAPALIIIYLAAVLADVLRNYFVLKKEGYLEPRTLWAENGLLKKDAAGYSEVFCEKITRIHSGKRLIMLGYPLSAKRTGWFILPADVFADAQETEAFLSLFGRPGAQEAGAREQHGGEEEEEADAVLTFSFTIDEEKWLKIYTEAIAMMQAGTLGAAPGSKLFLVVFGVIYAVAVAVWHFSARSHTTVFAIILFLILALVIFRRQTQEPGKEVRRRMKDGDVQNDIYGTWTVRVLEDGVENRIADKKKGFLTWDSFGWLVETDTTLFLMKKNRMQFIPIPAEDAKQDRALKEYCAGKGLGVLKGLKKKYVPGWAFALITACVILYTAAGICAYVVWERHQGGPVSGTAIAGGQVWEDADGAVFAPEAYPRYVPLKEQIQVLESFGFTVSGQIADGLTESLKDPALKPYIEGYAYTWLLSGMGAPTYDENGVILRYFDEVFWFDFEGWSPETDYIDILNGMLALAKGGPLDAVGNIREDADGVNWEEGSGSLNVLFTFNGAEYSFPMEVNYDWIDGSVLGIFNGLLDKEAEEMRFYVTGDDGQGAIVFYCLPDWADAFERATGLELDAPVTTDQPSPDFVKAI